MNYLDIASWNWQLPKHHQGRSIGEGLLRSERSPNVSDGSDPISIIIVVVVVQFRLRRRRGATVARIYFDLTATVAPFVRVWRRGSYRVALSALT